MFQENEDLNRIWEILDKAIQRRKKIEAINGKTAYPHLSIIIKDLEKKLGICNQ